VQGGAAVRLLQLAGLEALGRRPWLLLLLHGCMAPGAGLRGKRAAAMLAVALCASPPRGRVHGADRPAIPEQQAGQMQASGAVHSQWARSVMLQKLRGS
jgi:hypothetical protein